MAGSVALVFVARDELVELGVSLVFVEVLQFGFPLFDDFRRDGIGEAIGDEVAGLLLLPVREVVEGDLGVCEQVEVFERGPRHLSLREKGFANSVKERGFENPLAIRGRSLGASLTGLIRGLQNPSPCQSRGMVRPPSIMMVWPVE